MANLPRRYLPGFPPQHKFFFLLLSIPLFSLSWLPWWILWLSRISRTVLDNLLSRFTGPYRWLFCNQTMLWIHFSVSFFSPWDFFKSTLTDCLSLEFEWQQVLSSLLDSSQYPSLSQLYSSLDVLHSSSYFQVLQSLYQSFGDCTKSTNHNWYNRYFHVPQFFQFPSKVQLLILFIFFQFYSVLVGTAILQVLFFVDYYFIFIFIFCFLQSFIGTLRKISGDRK